MLALPSNTNTKGSTMKTTALFVATLLSAAALPAFAQSTPHVDAREQRQQARIDQGIHSGQLTEKEAARMDARGDRLEANEAAAKADGKVTRKERARLNAEAERNSRAIRHNKHDRQTR